MPSVTRCACLRACLPLFLLFCCPPPHLRTSLLRDATTMSSACAAPPGDLAASYIWQLNVLGVCCGLALVAFGRARRPHTEVEPPRYTPGPYKPTGDEGASRGAELKASALKPLSSKAKSPGGAKAATKRRLKAE